MHDTKIDTQTDPRSREGRRGAALLFALSILAVFSALGMIYLRHMELEVADTSIELRQKRARQLAMAGVESAAAGIQQYLLNPATRPIQLGSPYAVKFPTYRSLVTGDDGQTQIEEMGWPRLAESTFTIYDESGKVNLNHAPASVLQKVMGVSGDTARTIAASVPAGGNDPKKQWFLEVDELVGRGLVEAPLSPAMYETLTTYTVVDSNGAAAYLNVNAADASILAAVLDLTPEQAAQVKGKGPFSSSEALASAVAAARGVPVESVSPDPALGFQSRCFRVVCEGRYARYVDKDQYETASAADKRRFLMNVAVHRVEAVLLFDENAEYEIIHWNVDFAREEDETEAPAADDADDSVDVEDVNVEAEATA